jgi:hypothetical protein
MLQQLLRVVQEAKGPLTLDEIGRRLDVDRDALDGMVQTLVRLGRLRVDRSTASLCGMDCSGCAVAVGCSDVNQLPRTYSLVIPDDQDRSTCSQPDSAS